MAGSPGQEKDLATWIIRLSAKGEALRCQRRYDYRQVALISSAKSVAERQLFVEQKQTRLMPTPQKNHPHHRRKRKSSLCLGGGGMRAATAASSCDLDDCICDCEFCPLCQQHSAAGVNSCYCNVIFSPRSSSANASAWDDDDSEESKLIDDFLAALDSLPSKKQKRL
jgi:hypothetical protein